MVDQPVVLSESGESAEVEGPSARDVVYAERLEGGIEVVFLNQPKKKNALSAPMMGKLNALLSRADEDPAVRVVVLRGAGENFSSG